MGRFLGRGQTSTLLRGCFVAGAPRNDTEREQPADKVSPGGAPN